MHTQRCTLTSTHINVYSVCVHVHTHLLLLWLSTFHFPIKVGHHSNGLVQETLHVLLAAVGTGCHTIPLPPLSTLHPINEPHLTRVHCTKLYSLYNRGTLLFYIPVQRHVPVDRKPINLLSGWYVKLSCQMKRTHCGQAHQCLNYHCMHGLVNRSRSNEQTAYITELH